MKSLLTLTVFVVMFAMQAQAGDAGCGFGSMIIKSNTKVLQLLAVTTNHSFGSQTLGITFGTSGCSASGLVQNDKQIQYFVEVNQEDLMREMAQGRGDKLITLAALHGCASDAQVLNFNSQAQAQFKTIVPSAKTTAVEFVQNLKTAKMSLACQGS